MRPTHQRPRVLIVQHSCYADTSGIIRGIAHYQKTNQPWFIHLDNLTRADKDLRWITDERWDGVISGVETPELVETCLRLGVPVVELWDSPLNRGVPKVRPDNIAIGHMAAEHLLENRFRHFGFSGFSEVPWSMERLDGFLEALSLVGCSCDADLSAPSVRSDPGWDAAQIEQLAAWLARLPHGAAVMACDDDRARQLARAATLAQMRVPEDVAIIGVNNHIDRCNQEEPSLSSVATNDFEAGVRAAEQMELLMNGGRVKTAERRIEPVGVVVRRSTNTLAMRDAKVAAAVDYIREHACSGITVDQVVAQVHASRSQLESRFRRFLGHSPQVEIRRVQIEKIRSLLAETDLSLKEIADRTGFVHVEYMCVLFKRVAGETLGQYRRNQGAQERERALAEPGGIAV